MEFGRSSPFAYASAFVKILTCTAWTHGCGTSAPPLPEHQLSTKPFRLPFCVVGCSFGGVPVFIFYGYYFSFSFLASFRRLCYLWRLCRFCSSLGALSLLPFAPSSFHCFLLSLLSGSSRSAAGCLAAFLIVFNRKNLSIMPSRSDKNKTPLRISATILFLPHRHSASKPCIAETAKQ
jgi:hypothetical protein